MFMLKNIDNYKKINQNLPWQLRLLKDIKELEQRQNHLSIDKCISTILNMEWFDNRFNLNLQIVCLFGLFANEVFIFQLQVDNKYPYSPIQAYCINQKVHPNIDQSGQIRLPIFNENDWSAITSLYLAILALEYMLINPLQNNFEVTNHYDNQFIDQSYYHSGQMEMQKKILDLQKVFEETDLNDQLFKRKYEQVMDIEDNIIRKKIKFYDNIYPKIL